MSAVCVRRELKPTRTSEQQPLVWQGTLVFGREFIGFFLFELLKRETGLEVFVFVQTVFPGFQKRLSGSYFSYLSVSYYLGSFWQGQKTEEHSSNNIPVPHIATLC